MSSTTNCKPCPFCGRHMEEVYSGSYPNRALQGFRHPDLHGDCIMEGHSMLLDSKKLEKWNTRIDPR